ncbi:MAG: sugar phosphate nucleotidyltransferase [Oscillospiraceae bacterium]
MNKPILVVMAAGMGSRYGGLKQIDPVGPNGEIIIDYSLYDAQKAGFETVIFIIKPEIEADFKAAIGDRTSAVMTVKYAYQQVDDLPEGFTVPEGRKKPWGTAHAILCARELIDAPFAVINADDYYGASAFKEVYHYLSAPHPSHPYPFCMVAYELENTLTENGYVSRGVCETDENQMLTRVTERVRIEKYSNGAHFTEDDGKSWTDVPLSAPVSMNLWGFTPDYMGAAWEGFPEFLKSGLQSNPQKCEYFLPSVVTKLISDNKAQVKVLHSRDRWYGVTYKEDKPKVQAALKALHDSGQYPTILRKSDDT